jgi:hypothetical protein
MDCPEAEATLLLTRVIDVGDEAEGDTDFARVRTSGGVEAPYAALSYCVRIRNFVFLSKRSTFFSCSQPYLVVARKATLMMAP